MGMTKQEKIQFYSVVKEALKTPYPVLNTDVNSLATKTYADNKIAEAVSLLKGGVDVDHDTLKELADAIVAQAQQAVPFKKFYNTPVVYQTGTGNRWTFNAYVSDDEVTDNDGTTMSDYSDIPFLLFITEDVGDDVRINSLLSGNLEVDADENPIYAHKLAIYNNDPDVEDYEYATAGSLKKGDMCIGYYEDGDDGMGGTNTFFIDTVVRSGSSDEDVTVDDLEAQPDPLTREQLDALIEDWSNNQDDVDKQNAIINANVSEITDFSNLFLNRNTFNLDIGGWNTSSVTTMEGAFNGATNFNQDISNWDTNNVTNIGSMFFSAENFNQPIGNWNMSGVTNMTATFFGATNFNQDIGSWDTSNVIKMFNTFHGASHFNQNISSWNTGNVTDMYRMFLNATSFNQDLSGWDVSKVVHHEDFDTNTPAWTLPKPTFT